MPKKPSQSSQSRRKRTAKGAWGRRFRILDLTRAVLSMYGAQPLRAENDLHRNLGQIVSANDKTLVLVDSPNKATNGATLAKAIEQRDHLPGEWDKVVVLGWRFEAAIGASIAACDDPRLEVLALSSRLQERIKKRGRAGASPRIASFISRQYLTLKSVTRTQLAAGADELLIVTLDNYALLSPYRIKLDDAKRARLRAMQQLAPLALISRWEIDPDYDGRKFQAVWQEDRSAVLAGGATRRAAMQAVLNLAPRPGLRRIRVRTVDMFGLVTEVEVTAALSARGRAIV